jgi:hypothetical protein
VTGEAKDAKNEHGWALVGSKEIPPSLNVPMEFGQEIRTTQNPKKHEKWTKIVKSEISDPGPF